MNVSACFFKGPELKPTVSSSVEKYGLSPIVVEVSVYLIASTGPTESLVVAILDAKYFTDESEKAINEVHAILKERKRSGKLGWQACQVFQMYFVEAERNYLLRNRKTGDQNWLRALVFLREHEVRVLY